MRNSSARNFWGPLRYALGYIGATAIIWQIPGILSAAAHIEPPPGAYRICWLFTAILIPAAVMALIAAWHQRYSLVGD